MRAVVQRVSRARVTVGEETVGSCDGGFLVLLGVEDGDGPKDADYMIRKITGLRIFEDGEGKMNLSLADTGGSVLLVSQFTLLGDARNGNRPGFSRAARPEEADRLYLLVADGIRRQGIAVETGRFRTEMNVHLINQGPVTILLDSGKNF